MPTVGYQRTCSYNSLNLFKERALKKEDSRFTYKMLSNYTSSNEKVELLVLIFKFSLSISVKHIHRYREQNISSNVL